MSTKKLNYTGPKLFTEKKVKRKYYCKYGKSPIEDIRKQNKKIVDEFIKEEFFDIYDKPKFYIKKITYIEEVANEEL